MRAVLALKLLLVAFSLCAGSAAIAVAQEPTSDEPRPQPLPPNPLSGTPPAAPQAAAPALPPDLQACLQETGDYIRRGKAVLYVIGITNTCSKRLRCEIFANVTGARGSSLGHTVMVLGPAGSGNGTTKTYKMRVKSAGGTVQVSRECRVF